MNEYERWCAHEFVAASATATPGAIAVVAGSRRLTYADLNARANQLAHFLRANGVGPEVLVGLSLKRTPEVLVGLLGILKAGGAYVPLDPSYPAERLSFMMDDSRAGILVTTADLAAAWPATSARLVRLDADWRLIGKGSKENLGPTAGPEDLAYVIYTSGSTGMPKGVMVTHAGLVNYLLWAMKEYGLQARRSALVHSSISFDLTITGLFTPLLLGGRVELLAEDVGVDGLLSTLRANQNHGLIKITPAHLELLSRHLNPFEVSGKVGLFVIGGENLTSETLQFWRKNSPSTRLINEYGPTETVVGCCTYEVGASDPGGGSVPIGKPIDNAELYVLDAELRRLPAGTAGELYIGGAGVARGYLNQTELTEQRFLADPFSQRAGARMYKSGDLVRCRDSGIFEYLGRLDDQVKLRGYRIELGEVEAAIAQHPAVRQSAATVQARDGLGNGRLVGYAARREDHAISQAQLREFLRQKLPPYMVPSSIVFLDFLPLTLNGKVDRSALPALAEGIPEHHGPLIAPRNDVELELIDIFKKLFDSSAIGISDDFFTLGGDSLLMVELLIRIEKNFGKKLSMAAVFEAPGISQLAHVLRYQREASSEVIPIQPAGSLPPFFCVGAGPLFRPLAIRLGTERPFLGLMPTLSARFMQQPALIEDIAALSVEIIRKYQREGPYYLGGWSASGVLAYEIAQQLITSDHEVGLLVLFDVRNPAHSPQLLGERFESYSQKIRFLANELKKLKLRNVNGYVREKVDALSLRVKQASWNFHYPVAPEDVIHAAVSGYRPQPYTGRVTFFGATSRPKGRAWDFSQGWRDLVVGEFETHEIPGDHRSIFLEPNVAFLAKKMATYLSLIFPIFLTV